MTNLTFKCKPLSCDMSLERSNYQKNNEDYNMFLRHPCAKWWLVKIDQLSDVDRLPFWTGLTYKLSIGFLLNNRIIVFILS